jgi:proteasome lid subunit RPN8/RPN11
VVGHPPGLRYFPRMDDRPLARRVQVATLLLARLRQLARLALPREACGALLGTVDGNAVRVGEVLPLPNAAPEVHRFLLDANAVRAADAAATRAGLDVVGFYHSHPDGTAEPSGSDLEAAWPWYCYLIVEAGGGRVRVWRLADDRSAFVEDVLDAMTAAP